ncbi:hypothetical protein Ahy_B08g092259 [Arachis hypogaea]|uniref:CCHC-type domain-containing protein n=1 Tax=Arachis hypogaea TaxID=3818 RepID=A0A444Y3N4_ARAHY|nr:hypothetical protein Ahy_B08g092259 [Arachis hypogaea]
MEKVKRKNEDSWAYLNKWPKESWTKAYFSMLRSWIIFVITREVFNARIKEYRAKPILTILEEVRMFVMRTITKNKVKLQHQIGRLPPIQRNRLEKIRKESQKRHLVWCGNDGYHRFEIHGWPTNMAVDYLTWETDMHMQILADHRLNENPEDYCHKWLTMDSYRETYKHSLNPIPGHTSNVGEVSAPKIRRKPGPLKKKRRKDADEEPSGSKKSKRDATKLARKYKEFSCAYCGTKGHMKRSCSHRKADDIAAALTAAAATVIAKKKEKGSNTNETIEGQSSQDGEEEGDPVPATDVATSEAPTNVNAPSEIVLSQTPFSQPDNGDQEQVTPATRPNKLQPKRKAFPVPGSASVDPLQGVSAGTSLRMAEFMKFVPTPGVKPAFKPPRKK